MVIVMVVALIVFGPKKLPEVGRQLGQAIRELKKLTGELTESINNETGTVKEAFRTVSPYSLSVGPIDGEEKLSVPVEGYSKSTAMVESPLLVGHGDEETATISSAMTEASAVPLKPVLPKAGDEGI